MMKLDKTDPLFAGCDKLKFTTSQVGVDDLTSKSWKVLAEFGPFNDGLTYTLLGLGDPRDAEIAKLKAELAVLKQPPATLEAGSPPSQHVLSVDARRVELGSLSDSNPLFVDNADLEHDKD